MFTVKKSTPFLARAVAVAVATVGIVGILASGASQAAQASGNSTGTVIVPIAITSTADLSFGNFAAGTGAGTITVSTSGARTVAGVVTIGTGGTAARFDITGSAGATYSITHGGTAVLTNTGGAGETMTLTKFSDLTGADATSGNVATGTLSGLGTQSLFVGGTLDVGANQVAGTYTGTVIATVEYN